MPTMKIKWRDRIGTAAVARTFANLFANISVPNKPPERLANARLGHSETGRLSFP